MTKTEAIEMLVNAGMTRADAEAKVAARLKDVPRSAPKEAPVAAPTKKPEAKVEVKTETVVEAKPKTSAIERAAARPAARPSTSPATTPSKPPPPAETFTPAMYDTAMDAFERGAQQGREAYRAERSLPRRVANNAMLPVRTAMAALPPVQDMQTRAAAMQNPDVFVPNEVRAQEEAARENKPDLDVLLTAKRVPRTDLVSVAAKPVAAPKAEAKPTTIDLRGDTPTEDGKPMVSAAKRKLIAAGYPEDRVMAASDEDAALLAASRGL